MSLFPVYLVGSFPKPSYLKIPNWFDESQNGFSAQRYTDYMKHHNNKHNQSLLQKAFDEVIKEQIILGGDIITDGEIDRENYIWNFCRFCLNGFDFNNLKKVSARNGATVMIMPQIINKVSLKTESLDLMGKQWVKHQQTSSKPIKIAIPGPMTINDSTHNVYYANNVKGLLFDLAESINEFVCKLTNKYRVKYVQIDEPIWARKPEIAADIGFDAMKICFRNVSSDIYKSIHICCGYPDEVNDDDYLKADNHSYVKLLSYGMDDHLVNECGVNAISIEDGHDRIPMKFFKLIKKLDIILGSINITSTTNNYTKNEIIERVKSIIINGNIKPSKLLLAPDCGLAMLPIDSVRSKMKILHQARNELRKCYQSKL